MIKLGISSCFFYPDLERTTFGPKTLCYLENDMADYLTQKDVLPVLIPKLSTTKLKNLSEQLDALVLQGGSDLCPESYNGPYLNKKRWPGDRIRDEYELEIVDLFFQAKKPILGICRGAQLLNVYFGGTLYQDIETQVEKALQHRDALRYDRVSHCIEIHPDSELSKVYSSHEMAYVNSVHHQAIEKLGQDLVVEAICPEDGIIEAFRYRELSQNYVWAVQWHPEFSHTLGDQVLSAQPLIEYFLKQVKKYE